MPGVSVEIPDSRDPGPDVAGGLKRSNRTASRDLADLARRGAIIPLPGGGRSMRYALAGRRSQSEYLRSSTRSGTFSRSGMSVSQEESPGFSREALQIDGRPVCGLYMVLQGG